MIQIETTSRGIRRRFARFRRDEDGSLIVFSLYLLIIMLMIGGLAVDMMRYEVTRSRLQNTLDRGILAATDLDQPQLPEDVVANYFEIAGSAQFLNAPTTVSTGVNFRRVDANASATVPMMFANMIGITEMDLLTSSSAIERVENLEISLVLDISGSMRFNNRMDRLRPAAEEFVQTIFDASSSSTVTFNLVPYAGMTNPTPQVYAYLNGQDLGGGTTQTHCLELVGTDFDDANLPATNRSMVPNFMYWDIAPAVMDWGWCPSDANAIIWGSADPAAIVDRIRTMRMHDGTGTHYAMKWAVAGLSPDSAAMFDHLRGLGMLGSVYSNRPLAWNGQDSQKVIVLMTDGQITDQWRPSDPFDPDNDTVELEFRGSGDRTRLTRASDNVNFFFEQCDLAKANGVVIYTIAFEAPGGAESEMEQCASTPSHFFRVDGLEIQEAFDAIASEIHRLRLIH